MLDYVQQIHSKDVDLIKTIAEYRDGNFYITAKVVKKFKPVTVTGEVQTKDGSYKEYRVRGNLSCYYLCVVLDNLTKEDGWTVEMLIAPSEACVREAWNRTKKYLPNIKPEDYEDLLDADFVKRDMFDDKIKQLLVRQARYERVISPYGTVDIIIHNKK